MYEDGIQSLVHGWVKHFSVGATATSPKVMTSIVIWLMGSIITASGLILSLLVKPISKVNMGILYILYTMQFIRIHRRVGHFHVGCYVCTYLIYLFSGVFYHHGYSLTVSEALYGKAERIICDVINI